MGFVRLFSRFLTTWSPFHGSPADQGRCLAGEITWGKITPDQPTVLAARRAQFSKDIDEMRLRTQLNWATISAVKIRLPQENWVVEADRTQTYLSHILEQRGDEIKDILAEFGVSFLKEAQRKYPIDAFMAANFDYWQDEAMKMACKVLNIPFLVLCRENYTIPWTAPWLQNRIADAKFTFTGAGVACFSDVTKKAMSPGVRDPRDIWVTGAPRYDRWLDLPLLPQNAKDHISLITFNDPGYGAANLFGEILEIFSDAASACKTRLTWFVKCKKRADMELVRSRLERPNPHLTFGFDVPLFELFPRSRLVIGYNSLAIVEALLTDAPVILPWWGQAKVKQDDLLLDPDDPKVAEVFHIARSRDEMAALLRRAADGEDLRRGTASQRRAIFNYHLHVPETGNASEAVDAFVRHYVDLYRIKKSASA